MDWTVVSAIGTVLAAFVGIIGIWLHLWDRKRKLIVSFESIPKFHIFITNDSLRSVYITKMICSIDNHVFYAYSYSGLQEVCLAPASVYKLDIMTKNIYDNYFKAQMDVHYKPDEKIVISLYDNYRRKYIIQPGYNIAAYKCG